MQDSIHMLKKNNYFAFHGWHCYDDLQQELQGLRMLIENDE